jgi:hypothetical protein
MRALGIKFETLPALLLSQTKEVEYIDGLAPIPNAAVGDAVQTDFHRILLSM